MTMTLEGGEWSAARPGRTLPPEKTRYPLYWRLGGPQGQSGQAENLAPPGFDPQTVQPVVSSSSSSSNSSSSNSSMVLAVVTVNPWSQPVISSSSSSSSSNSSMVLAVVTVNPWSQPVVSSSSSSSNSSMVLAVVTVNPWSRGTGTFGVVVSCHLCHFSGCSQREAEVCYSLLQVN